MHMKVDKKRQYREAIWEKKSMLNSFCIPYDLCKAVAWWQMDLKMEMSAILISLHQYNHGYILRRRSLGVGRT